MISIDGEELHNIDASSILSIYSKLLIDSFRKVADSDIFEYNLQLVKLEEQKALLDDVTTKFVALLNVLIEYQKVIKILLSNSSSSSGQKEEISNQKEV